MAGACGCTRGRRGRGRSPSRRPARTCSPPGPRCSGQGRAAVRPRSVLVDRDRVLGTVRHREPGLVLQLDADRAVADHERLPVVVDVEQLRGERIAPVVALTLLAVDTHPRMYRAVRASSPHTAADRGDAFPHRALVVHVPPDPPRTVSCSDAYRGNDAEVLADLPIGPGRTAQYQSWTAPYGVGAEQNADRRAQSLLDERADTG